MNRIISFKNNSLAKIFSSSIVEINAMELRLFKWDCVYMDVRHKRRKVPFNIEILPIK